MSEESKIIDTVSAYGDVRGQKDLAADQLSFVGSLAKPLATLLVNSCDSHALLRLNLTCENNALIGRLESIDINGTLKAVYFYYDMSDKNADLVTKGAKFVLKNKGPIVTGLLDLLEKISNKIPFNVGMLDIPLEGNYLNGVIVPYNPEPGTFLIRLESSKKYDFLSNGTPPADEDDTW